MAERKKTTYPLELTTGRKPPQSIELEEAVIGGMLIESKAFYVVAPILSPVSFYKEEHAKIYQAILDLNNSGTKIDLLTVPEQLRKNQTLDEIGGIAFVNNLTQRVASAYHIESHAKIVQQKFVQREFIRISSELQNMAFDDSIDVDSLIDYSQVQINQLVQKNITKPGRRFSTIGGERLKELEELSKNDVQFTGIPSGFTKIDRHTGGWQNTDLILLAGRPSMGKSFLGFRLAVNATHIGKKKVAFFTLEMTDKQLWDRELSYETGIENSRIRKGNLDPEDWEKIEKAQGKFEDYDIIIDDTPALRIMDFRSKALMYKLEHGIDIIIIDYIQLMKSPDHSFNKQLEVGYISESLKAIAKELNIPIVALSQLSRKVEDRNTKRPQLSDLSESGKLEQDADLVGFIHRPEYYKIKKMEDDTSTKNLIEFIIAKHRNGPIGTFRLWKTDNWTQIFENKPGDNIPPPPGGDLPF